MGLEQPEVVKIVPAHDRGWQQDGLAGLFQPKLAKDSQGKSAHLGQKQALLFHYFNFFYICMFAVQCKEECLIGAGWEGALELIQSHPPAQADTQDKENPHQNTPP